MIRSPRIAGPRRPSLTEDAATTLPQAVRLMRAGMVIFIAILLAREAGSALPDAAGWSSIRVLLAGLVVLELTHLLPWIVVHLGPVTNAARPVHSAPNFMTVLDTCFGEWDLTNSEAAVALLAIKGFSNAEIARLRETAEATVKCQLNAIYRKAGLTGRSQLISTVLDEVVQSIPAGHETGPVAA